MFYRALFLSLSLLFSFLLYAQDYDWWNQKHNWDGYTSWTEYLIISPAYMGPNALPVPEVKKGILPKSRSLELGIEGHFNKGDQTGNLYTELFFPLFSQRVGLGISYVPLEMYKTDTITRDLRRSREYDPSGFSLGDVYFSTYIHLVKEKEKIPDVLLSVNLKTASGSKFDGARHTNAPGYYFDLSAGKKFFTGEQKMRYIRMYALVGFYVFQTNLNNNMQNDAFQYGTGLDLNFGRFQLDQQWSGYIGYLGNGDKPMVYRLILTWYSQKTMDLKLRFQQGFFDFPYTTVRLSTVIKF